MGDPVVTDKRKSPGELRSARWFAPDDLRAFGHRSRTMQMGYAPEEWKDRPVIAILNTWSDAQPCHTHFKPRVDDVKRGVLQAGGFPIELPALSLSESLREADDDALPQHAGDGGRGIAARPSGRRRGADGRLRQDHAGAADRAPPAWTSLRSICPRARCCAATGRARPWAPARTPGNTGTSAAPGKISDKDWLDIEAGIARSYGTCMTMGTASTMTAIAEAIGMTLPGASSIPAADAGHIRMASECGRRIVEMVWEDLTPAKIQTRKAFENAIAVAMAMGCSTNAIIHLIAQARRAGQDIGLDDFEIASRKVPVIANIRPSGDTYLMEDFFYAGGLPGLMSRIRNISISTA